MKFIYIWTEKDQEARESVDLSEGNQLCHIRNKNSAGDGWNALKEFREKHTVCE